MIDTIYREDALAEFVDGRDVFDIMASIEDLPSSNEWIPCSERLPEPYESVIVTDSKGRVFENYRIKIGWSKGFNIIAWQPLPNPYKGGE